jgi:peptide/nickel transport system substrate-binding protein
MLQIGPGDTYAQDAPQARPQPVISNDLLRTSPFDRITLIDGTELVVEPVSPRPLPPYDPSKDRKPRRKRTPSPTENLIEIGADKPSPKADEAQPLRGPRDPAASGDGAEPGSDPSQEISVHLLQAQGQAEVRDFRVRRSSIKNVEYFEDMLLAEGARLVLARDFARAFECYLFVKTRNPGWAGLDDHVNRLLFAEGSRALTDGDHDRGMRLLRELQQRKPDFPGLLDQLAASYEHRVEKAAELGLFARARSLLHDLEGIAPDHPITGAIRSRLIERASQRFQAAGSLTGPERLDALTEAVRIWPDLSDAASQYEEAFRNEPTLDVAVPDVANPVGPWVHSPADARISRLLYRPVLMADDDAARRGEAPEQLASSIESTDLGRRLVIQVREGMTWSDGSRPVSSIDLARTFIDRSDPHSPRYQARWADLLDRVESLDENRVEVRFNRGVLQWPNWLMGPVGPAHAGEDGRIATSKDSRPLVTNNAYGCEAANDDRIELRRSTVSGEGSPNPSIRRIREVRVRTGSGAVAALLRGDVSLIGHVAADQVDSLRRQPEIQVGTYAKASLHRIAIDGRNPWLRNRNLRRGISYAIDRKTLLEEHLLKRPGDEQNAVSDGPFPKGGYADVQGIQPLGFEPWLARMLVAGARKELGAASLTLKFEYPEVPEAQIAAPRIATALRAVGLEIELIPRSESRLEAELRSGRRFDLVYRISRCDDPVFEAGPLICPAFDASPETDPLASAPSPRILQLLLQLERAAEFSTARNLVRQIDREARDELPSLPLWQLQDHYAWRTRLKGPPETTESLYQGIENWEIAPWIAKDPWNIR